jgi:hypothetical protein
MKKKQPDQKFLSTKSITGSPQFLERCYNELIRIIEKRKKTSKSSGKLILELDRDEFDSVVSGLKRARKIAYLKADLKKSKDETEYFDVESLILETKIKWAKEAIPKKGATPKNYKEAAFRIGIEKPKKGKRTIFDPEEVLAFHKKLIVNLKKKNKTLRAEQKQRAVEEVQKQFLFASYDSTRRYLTLYHAKNLPWSKPS